MLQPKNDHVIDVSPSAIADLLEGLVDAQLETDRELAQILSIARNDLRTLAWNRYARGINRRSRGNVLRRRHQQEARPVIARCSRTALLKEGQAHA